jgi:hypothetical protein
MLEDVQVSLVIDVIERKDLTHTDIGI